MKTILIVIAATFYAIGLWLFAPQKTWDSEVKKAKNRNNTPTPTPTPTATPQTWTVAKLRKEAQKQQIKWKDATGKPLKKSELMRILAI